MKSVVFVHLLFAISQIAVTKCEDEQFENPPFLQYNLSDTRVKFNSSNERGQVILMDEDIDENITIAILNYNGNEEPLIGLFMAGSNTNLGAVIEKTDTKWLLTITKEQDYETPAMQKYIFPISIQKDTKHIYLYINNIDNKPPVIKAEGSVCSFEENSIGPTNCFFQVSDPDGFIDELQYTIIGKKNESKIFEIKTHPITSTSYETKIELVVKEKLDFETISLYTFTIEAKDTGDNIGTTTVVLQVIDVPDMPPVWESIFSTKEFLEKEPQTYSVNAKDGDRNIDAEINYRLEGASKFFSIDEKTGVILVEAIDRDAEKNEFFPFTVVAYEALDHSSFINFTIVMIVKDINDNPPKISFDSTLVKIPEGTSITLDKEIIVNDIDSVENAQYSVSLRDADDGKIKWYEAFTIIPNKGYQEGHFTISVSDPSKLDYENATWKDIQLEVFAIEDGTEEKFNCSKVLNIQLLNLNDESPVFTDPDPVANVLESIGAGELITTLIATDKDEDDDVVYSLVGSITQRMEINPLTGELRTVKDKVFDFETQPEVIIQVQATDILIDNYTNIIHTTTVTLTINVTDENDETPTIYTPPAPYSITENVPDKTKVIELRAFDPDTNANLIFTIDWSQTKAFKQGLVVDPKFYENCFVITTKYNDGLMGDANGTILVKERDSETLDYEKYDIIHLSVQVKDTEQKLNEGTASVILPISIIDENDCEPMFNNDTESKFIVKDKAKKDITIGYVRATDEDGPQYNRVYYYMSPENGTESNLVQLHENRGELTVVDDNIIDCDYNDGKYKEYLYYKIIATDCKNNSKLYEEEICFSTPLHISIFIEDSNDQTPLAESPPQEIKVPEDAKTGYSIYNITAFDKDRDVPYHTINYQINTLEHPELKPFFNVDKQNGNVYVDLKGEGLDRDVEPSSYTIYIKLQDNADGLGDIKESTLSFRVVLQDVNDNAPEFLEPFVFSKVNENISKEFEIGTVKAIDIDEPGTVNSTVVYSLLKVWKSTDNDSDYLDYFEIINKEDHGSVITKKPLQGLYGTFYFLIKAQDKGTPPQSNSAKYELEISKFNYEKPQIVFPRREEPLLLSQIQNLNRPLNTVDNELLENFQANDGHNGDKWDIEFILESDIFELKYISGNSTQLQLVKEYTEIDHNLVLTARINSIPMSEDSMKLRIVFVDPNSYPTFKIADYQMSFHENITGLDESYDIPEANDDNDVLGNLKPVYYFITDKDSKFALHNNTSRSLKVATPLDREDIDKYNVTIVTTNINSIPINPPPNTTVIIKIDVIDINDNPPTFTSPMVKGITTANKMDDLLLTLSAKDLDLEDKLTYHRTDKVISVGDHLENVPDPPFSVNENSGQITLNFQVRSEMNGYFTFTVEVHDSEYQNTKEGHFDRSTVKIYIISDVNRVIFEFENDVDIIEEEKDSIADIFTETLENKCTIDRIERSVLNDVPLNNRTKVTTFFTSEDQPVSAEEIRMKADQTAVASQMQNSFSKKGLYLLDVKTINENVKDMTQFFQTILIALSVILGMLCACLLAAFFLRTRTLTKRLDALSNTQFGSNASNLNRIGMPAPNTNLHAIEGSNPVWKEDVKPQDIDNISLSSGDSDMIGIENNQEFSYDRPRASFNPVIQNEIVKREGMNPVTKGPPPTEFRPAFLH